MSGPSKKPSELKKLEGSYREDRVAPNEMEVAKHATTPPPPEYFSETARKIFYQVTEELSGLGMLHKVDTPILEQYCFMMGQVEKLAMDIEDNGVTIEMTNNKLQTNVKLGPNIQAYNMLVAQANRLAQQFGFTPSARTKISMPKQADDDPLAGFLND